MAQFLFSAKWAELFAELEFDCIRAHGQDGQTLVLLGMDVKDVTFLACDVTMSLQRYEAFLAFCMRLKNTRKTSFTHMIPRVTKSLSFCVYPIFPTTHTIIFKYLRNTSQTSFPHIYDNFLHCIKMNAIFSFLYMILQIKPWFSIIFNLTQKFVSIHMTLMTLIS